MLSSLISIYIATALQPSFNPDLLEKIGLNFEENISPAIKNPYFISPLIDAEGSIAVDLKSNQILYEKNANRRLQIASITKLMTILIILEENKMDEVVKVSPYASSIEGSEMFLRTNEEITVENLLYGALIHSANDAAIALAEHNAGSADKFVEKMNAKATSLGLSNTHFSNPAGLDSSDNYSSAIDVVELSRQVYKNDFVKNTAIIKNMTVKSIDGNHTHKLESTNDLLNSYLKIKGLKTGKTDSAGLCLVAIAENENKNEIITVVLNSPARFQESKILIDWVFRAYKW